MPVLANAVVNVEKPATPKTLGHFKVEVWGKEPYDYVRYYDIMAKNENLAAQEGIARFVAEMEQMAPNIED